MNYNQVIINPINNTVEVLQPVAQVIEVISQGPQGPVGPPGSSQPFESGSGGFYSTSSLFITGSITATEGFTGSLYGTSSWAESSSYAIIAQTASYFSGSISNAVSSSYALTASYAENANINTGSLVTTSSFNAFTSSVNSFTASYNTGSFTGSFIGSLLGTASYANQALSSSYALSASYAATASSADQFNVRVALTASGLRYPTADNGEFSFIQTDGAGNLSLQYVNTIYETIISGESTQISKGTPLYVSGSQGASSIVYRADAGNPAKMPVTYIAGDNIAPNTTARGIVLGLITGVNTTGYPEGTEIYVAVGGGWTAIRPTGSAIIQVLGIVTKEGNGGQGLVLNSGPSNLPNLSPGYVWIGNSGSYPTPTPTSSIQNVVSSSYALSASFAPTNTTGSFTGSFTGSLLGTASYANQALSSSFALTASYALNAGTTVDTGSLVTTSSFNSFTQSINIFTASYNTGSFSGSFTGSVLGTSSWAVSSSQALTASFYGGSVTSASYASSSTSASYALTSSLPLQGVVTASATNTTITFTKGDGSTFSVTVSQSGSVATASYALTAESASYAGTASLAPDYTLLTNFDSFTSSINSFTASYNTGSFSGSFTGSFSGSFTGSLLGTSSWAVSASQAVSSSYSTTASYALNAGITIDTGSFVTTSSFNSFTSSINSFTASYNTGSFSGSFTGSVLGTSSWAISASQALTASFYGGSVTSASYASSSTSASYAETASLAPNYTTLTSFNNFTSSYNTGSFTGSFTGSLLGTSSWAVSSSQAVSSSYTLTASYALNAGTTVDTGSFVTTSSFNSFTSSINSFTASYNTGSFTGSFTGSLLGTSSWAISSSQAVSSSYALTASYALSAPGGAGNPGGNDTEIQYNNNGSFGGVPTLTYSGSVLRATGSFSGSFTGSFEGTSSWAISASWAPSSPATLNFWSESLHIVNSISHSVWEPLGNGTNISTILQPKGTGYISANTPDQGVSGGNTRGTYAVDLQLQRSSATQVATGNRSAIVGGYRNSVGAANSIVLGGDSNNIETAQFSAIAGGANNTALGVVPYSFIGGGQLNTIDNQESAILAGRENRTKGRYSVASGLRSFTNLFAEKAHSSGIFTVVGDCQTSEIRAYRSITGTASADLTLDGQTPTSTSRITIPLPTSTNVTMWNANINFSAMISSVGNGTSITQSDSFTGVYNVAIKRSGSVTSLINPVQTLVTQSEAAPSLMSSSIVTIQADNTNNALQISFTPPAGANSTTVTRTSCYILINTMSF